MVATLVLTIWAVSRYPEGSSQLEQVYIQGETVGAGLLLVVAIIFLGFWISLTPRRLLREACAELDERLVRKPLRVERTYVGPERRWHHLIVYNPNEFAVHRAYVRVSGSDLLTEGFRFNWSTHETDERATRFITIPAHRSRTLDCCRRQDNGMAEIFQGDFHDFYQLTSAAILQPGSYQFDLELGSEGTEIPHSQYRIFIETNVANTLVSVSPAVESPKDEGMSQARGL